MMQNIETPHLPQGRVRHIIIGEKYRNMLQNALFRYNIDAIWLPDNPYVDDRLKGHADLSAVHIGNDRIVLTDNLKECEEINKITSLGYKVSYTPNLSDKYPCDAKLNFCILGDRLIHNPKTSDTETVNSLELSEIRVRQGYTKCSICIVNDCAVITSDSMIFSCAMDSGIDALLISKPFVKLAGFDYGFIGGASFKISKDRLAFTGRISDEEIRNSIESFLHKHCVEPIYLTDEEIFDIGSAIPITEDI